MDYKSMSLVELKQHAKNRGNIKQYYIMKRAELIRILSLPELPITFTLEKMTIQALREEATKRGIRGFWSLRKNELLELLFPQWQSTETASNKNQQDESRAKKHNYPEEHDSQEVGIHNM
jgi:hypothetical protein